jgi:PAS domain S-box-containing protein
MAKRKRAGEPANGGSSAQEQLTNLQSPEIAPYWLSALIESADDAIVSKTLDGIITSWNKGAERIFGFTAEEAVGKPITIIIPPDHLNEEPKILARLRAGERVHHFETVRQRKDGSLLEISLTISPIIGPHGEIVGASKIARDITEQRQARRAFDEASERLKLALAAAHLGDWSWDAETDLVTVSDTAARIFGVPPGEPMTRNEMRSLLQVEDRERARLTAETALANHTDYEIEYLLKRRDGSEAWISAKGRGIYDKDGNVVGQLGFVQDISERKNNEEMLREQADALRTLNEVGQLISAELDLHKTVQAVTDAATELTGARFGSFFYNVLTEEGASYMLFTLAGVPREAFAHFPHAAGNRSLWSNLPRGRRGPHRQCEERSSLR